MAQTFHLNVFLFIFSSSYSQHSEVHMYMGQPPVYAAAPGAMAPADIQSYPNPGSAVGPAQCTAPANYSAPSGTSLAPPSDIPQAPYSEKALL